MLQRKIEKGMQRLWGRKINDLGFYSFVQILKYEALKNGVIIIEIPKFYPSSQTCSECGYKNPEVKDLRVRLWKCPKSLGVGSMSKIATIDC